MLTDQEIATRLERQFNEVTHDLHYTRRVTPPRPRVALVLAPAATFISAAAVGAVVVGQQSAVPTPPAPGILAPSPSLTTGPSATTSPAIEMATMKVAGYTFSYPRAEHPDAELARIVLDAVPVPDGARSLPARDGVKAWVAPYPGTGRSGLWFQSPSHGGKVVALIPNDWGEDQLAQLWSTRVPDPH